MERKRAAAVGGAVVGLGLLALFTGPPQEHGHTGVQVSAPEDGGIKTCDCTYAVEPAQARPPAYVELDGDCSAACRAKYPTPVQACSASSEARVSDGPVQLSASPKFWDCISQNDVPEGGSSLRWTCGNKRLRLVSQPGGLVMVEVDY